MHDFHILFLRISVTWCSERFYQTLFISLCFNHLRFLIFKYFIIVYLKFSIFRISFFNRTDTKYYYIANRTYLKPVNYITSGKIFLNILSRETELYILPFPTWRPEVSHYWYRESEHIQFLQHFIHLHPQMISKSVNMKVPKHISIQIPKYANIWIHRCSHSYV